MPQHNETPALPPPAGHAPSPPNTPVGPGANQGESGGSFEAILARIPHQQTREYCRSPSNIYGQWTQAVAAEMDNMWLAISGESARDRPSPPAGVTHHPAPTPGAPQQAAPQPPSHIVPPTTTPTPEVTDQEAQALRAFMAQHFSFPNQGSGRLTSELMLALQAMAERIAQYEAFVRTANDRLAAAFGADANAANSLDHANAIAHLVGFIQTRDQIAMAANRLPKTGAKQGSGR